MEDISAVYDAEQYTSTGSRDRYESNQAKQELVMF